MQKRNDAGTQPVVTAPANAGEAANLIRDIHGNVAEMRTMAERTDARSTEISTRVEAVAAQVVAQEEALAAFRRERLARPANDADAIRAAPSQSRAALESFMRTGDLAALTELRAVRNDLNERATAGHTGVNETGGYLVLPEFDAQVDKFARVYSGLRNYASIKVIGGTRYEKRRKVSGTTANWEGEGEGATATDALKWGMIAIDLHQLRSEPEYSVESLEDPFLNMEAEIAEDLGEAFGQKEAPSHITGTGVKQPTGILTHSQAEQTTVGGAELSWNQVGYVKTGQAALWGAANAEGDIFRRLPFYARSEFLPNSAFYMNRKSLSQLVLFKDANKQYIWQPSLRDGTPQTLVGYGVRVLEEMPDMEAGATPVAFGDMAAAYLILDKAGVQILRNPYRTSGQVTFFARKRTGGGVRKGEALKLIKIAA